MKDALEDLRGRKERSVPGASFLFRNLPWPQGKIFVCVFVGFVVVVVENFTEDYCIYIIFTPFSPLFNSSAPTHSQVSDLFFSCYYL